VIQILANPDLSFLKGGKIKIFFLTRIFAQLVLIMDDKEFSNWRPVRPVTSRVARWYIFKTKIPM
jgi:hypothetical protein